MHRLLVLPLLALIVGTPALTQQAAPAAQPERDIVVTGQSLRATADALAACLARNCPPDEDIAATLAHAENQFVSGDYRSARATTLASIRRNNDEGRAYPLPVSDLYRANGRIAAHLGEAAAFQSSVLNMRDTLDRGLGENDPRTLAAQIEVGDSRSRLGYPDEARDIYLRTAAAAERAGVPRVAAFARLRVAMADLAPKKDDRIRSRARDAVSKLEAIAGQGDTVGRDIALMAEVTLARVEREDGDMTRTQGLVSRFAAGGGARRPLLLSGEPVRLQDAAQSAVTERSESQDSGNILSRTTAGVDDRWIDVGYWINADGRIDDYEVLRQSGGLGGWTEAVERSVKSRIYAPLAPENGVQSPGFYIVERYTLTADFADQAECTGSRLRCRSSNLRVERTDLTPEDLGAQPARG